MNCMVRRSILFICDKAEDKSSGIVLPGHAKVSNPDKFIVKSVKLC